MRRWSRGRSGRSLRPLRWAQGTLVIASGLAVLVGGSGLVAARSDTPPLRDLDRARAELADAVAARAEATRTIASLEAELAALEAGSVELTGTSVTLIAELEQRRRQATAAAVDAYVGGRDVAELLYALDTEVAADATYRTELVEAHAAIVVDLSTEYHQLREQASDELLALLDERDRLATALALATRALARAEAVEADAAWVVDIATVHAAADELMVENGRTEPTAEQWAELRHCEAREQYDIASGNGYYGAYQFDLTTWVGVGGSGSPALAPVEEQDARARYLFALRGSQPWPVCGRYLP